MSKHVVHILFVFVNSQNVKFMVAATPTFWKITYRDLLEHLVWSIILKLSTFIDVLIAMALLS